MMHRMKCVLLLVLLMIADGLIVKGPSGPVVAPLGSSGVLLCSVDELLSVEDLQVQWTRSDSDTLVHLYQDGESRPEAQQQDYQDRAHFFTEEIHHGNFSLRLDDLRAEDEGHYTCTVHSQQESGETVLQLKVDDVERLRVSGSSHSVSVSVDEDVTLSCSVDSHIPPEDLEVSWMKTDEDADIMVLLYQDHEPLPEASDDRYRDRVEFFRDEIQRGNFSLRLKSVRTEDKGVYMCEVSAGGLSVNTTVVLERLGFSVLHIVVLILCIFASGLALLLCCLIYCKSLCKVMKPKEQMRKCEVLYDFTAVEEDELDLIVGETIEILSEIDNGWWMGRKNNETGLFPSNYVKEIIPPENTVFRLQMCLVFCPNVLMFLALLLWGVSEGSLFETVSCCALYFLRPLMLLWTAPYIDEFTDKIKKPIQWYSYEAEYVFFSAVFYLVLFKSVWDKSLNYTAFEGVMIIVLFVIVLLFNLIYIIFLLVKFFGKLNKRIRTIFRILASISFDVLPSLQFILLFFSFGSSRGGFIIMAVLPVFLSVKNYDWDFTCGQEMGCSPAFRRSVYLTLIILINAVLVYFYITALENEKDRVGWSCMIVFLQLLWALINFTRSFPSFGTVFIF